MAQVHATKSPTSEKRKVAVDAAVGRFREIEHLLAAVAEVHGPSEQLQAHIDTRTSFAKSKVVR